MLLVTSGTIQLWEIGAQCDWAIESNRYLGMDTQARKTSQLSYRQDVQNSAANALNTTLQLWTNEH